MLGTSTQNPPPKKYVMAQFFLMCSSLVQMMPPTLSGVPRMTLALRVEHIRLDLCHATHLERQEETVDARRDGPSATWMPQAQSMDNCAIIQPQEFKARIVARAVASIETQVSPILRPAGLYLIHSFISFTHPYLPFTSSTCASHPSFRSIPSSIHLCPLPLRPEFVGETGRLLGLFPLSTLSSHFFAYLVASPRPMVLVNGAGRGGRTISH